MLLGQVLQVWVSVVCQRLGVGWFCAAWVWCGPLEWDSLDVLWVRTVLVVMMRLIRVNVHDEMSVIWVVMFHAVFNWISWRMGQLLVRSWNITCFLASWPGVLKGVNVFTSHRNVLFGLRRVLKGWSIVTQGLQISSISPVLFAVQPFDHIWASSFQNFCHCPCQPLNLCTMLFLREESNLFAHFQDFHVLGLVSLVKVFFLHLLDF